MYSVIKTVKEGGFAQLGLDPCVLEDELNKVSLWTEPTLAIHRPSADWSPFGGLSAGRAGNGFGLHRLHRSHDPLPGLAVLVGHVLLHADQSGPGQHDRHHDWHHHTRP